MNITIAKAVIGDLPEILALQQAAYQSEAALYNDLLIPPLRQTLAELEAEFANKVFLKAVTAEELVGSVRLAFDGRTCHIGRLIVHPPCQGQGIGTRLMGEAEVLFPQAARFELFTGSRSADNIRLYERLGYRLFREEDLSASVRLVYMEKCRPENLHR